MKTLLILLLLILSVPGYCETSGELVTKCREYAGKNITLEGEIIGEVAKRGGNAWLNISDGNYGIGVFAPISIIPAISHTGNHNAKGAVVSVAGTLHRACPEHGGGLDIHAATIKLVSHGYFFQHAIQPDRIRAVLFLGLIAIIVISLYHLKNNTRRTQE
ncbi:DNA-binding protein [Candidatus Desantisbacteria bacterium]|nr:DNA-binding protein [Candidatus Desantisbacteria bacterium]